MKFDENDQQYKPDECTPIHNDQAIEFHAINVTYSLILVW